MGNAVGPTPLRVPILPAGTVPHPPPIYRAPTCDDLGLSTGGRYSRVCKHSAASGCDLRVVGMTTYRIPG